MSADDAYRCHAPSKGRWTRNGQIDCRTHCRCTGGERPPPLVGGLLPARPLLCWRRPCSRPCRRCRLHTGRQQRADSGTVRHGCTRHGQNSARHYEARCRASFQRRALSAPCLSPPCPNRAAVRQLGSLRRQQHEHGRQQGGRQHGGRKTESAHEPRFACEYQFAWCYAVRRA